MSTESTLKRAIEQLAGCLAKETKVSSRGQSTTACKVAYPLVINATWSHAVNLASPWPLPYASFTMT